MEFWLVGQEIGKKNSDGRYAWDFQGIFSTKKKAEAACKDESYFVMPNCIVDEELPKESVEHGYFYH